jgi:hypothetical protein
MMIEGMTLDEADQLGDAIRLFAEHMGRLTNIKAFQIEDELAARH